MSFLETDTLGQERFSLLLLEPGEIYFEDFSVFYYPAGLSEHDAIKRKQRGHLKMCSKSIVFVPKDIQFPIVKFPMKYVTNIDQWSGGLFSKLDVKDKVLKIISEQAVDMKEKNITAPFIFRKGTAEHKFSLNYAALDDCLPLFCQLQRASTLPPADQSHMINAIVLSRQTRVKFNTSWLEDLYEKIVLESQGDRITPLAKNPGRIMLTSSRLYFQPFNNIDKWPVLKIRLKDIRRLIRRRFLLRQLGLEIYCSDNAPVTHLYLSFKTEESRNQLYEQVLEQKGTQPIAFENKSPIHVQLHQAGRVPSWLAFGPHVKRTEPNPKDYKESKQTVELKLDDSEELNLDDIKQEDMTLRWQSGYISNYEYLLYLNSLADRSFNDLTQYPVMPWVIADFTSTELDLQDNSVYRDLNKPVGALNQERLDRIKERFQDMPEPRFMYGSHYSTPGYVLFFLARICPDYVLCLQNGKFDHPDRMFNSLQDTWNNCLHGAADFKELIPEFYSGFSDFLVHKGIINFGIKQDGRPVGDVDLPPWASGPEDFIKKLKAALESEYVSANIHHWIDLIFGFQQRGEEAEKANNCNIEDPNERAGLETQIMEFGQVPKQLFVTPHPQRFCTLPVPHHLMTPTTAVSAQSDGKSRQTDVNQHTDTQESSSGKALESEEAVNKPVDFTKIKKQFQHTLHKDAVTDVRLSVDGKNVFSVSHDSMLKMYSLEEQRQLRSVNMSSMALSSCLVMPDNRTIIVGSWDNNVYFYSIEYGRVLDTLHGHDDAVSSIAWRADILYTASWDSSVKIWQMAESEPGQPSSAVDYLAQLDHDAGVTCVDLDVDSRLLVTGTKDGQLCVWDLHTQYLSCQLAAHHGRINAVLISEDRRRILSCGVDNYIKVLDTGTGTEIFTKDVQGEILCLHWAGSLVVSGNCSGYVQVWDMDKGQILHQSKAHHGAVTSVDVGEDGRLLSGGRDKTVTVWQC